MENEELEVAVDAAREAGDILLKYYGRVRTSYKSDRSLVTDADIKSEEKIRTLLADRFPNYSLLGEEIGYNRNESGYTWVIDPLDGTTNYVMKNPFFSVSIGLIYGRDPVLGVVYYPFEEEMFVAEKGGKAFLNGREIRVSDQRRLKDSLITYCSGRDARSIESVLRIYGKIKWINNKVRQLGAASLELCYVACGRTDGFVMPGLNAWDVAAGALIIKEASGMISDFDDKPFTIDSRDILASNGRLHRQLLRLIGKSE